MWALGSLIGMVVYAAILVLLGVNSWALDFRASTGHPTGNDFVLLVIGAGFSAFAGVLASITAKQRESLDSFEKRRGDLANATLYFDLKSAQQKAVEDWLKNVAKLWKEKHDLYFSILEMKDQDLDTISQRLRDQEEWVKRYEKQFFELYDFAYRVFGKEAVQRSRDIRSYLGDKSKVIPPTPEAVA